MGICECHLWDGTYCQNETVWNDMCPECGDAYESMMHVPNREHPRFFDGRKRGKINIEDERDDTPTKFVIKTTDGKFALRLINFLNDCKVVENSTTLRVE